jgi:hypothetical protein
VGRTDCTLVLVPTTAVLSTKMGGGSKTVPDWNASVPTRFMPYLDGRVDHESEPKQAGEEEL